MHTRSHARQGFTLVEVVITFGIIGILASISIPSYIRYRAHASQNLCIQNLSKIEAVKQTWGLESHKSTGDTPQDEDLFGPASYIRTKPICPSGGEYTLNSVGVAVTCSFPGHVLPE